MLLTLGLSACTPLVGGAALLGAVSIGVLTSRCYDYVDVTVLDADGRKTCAARVTASKGGSQFELSSCYYASLTEGRWTLRATLPGSTDAVTTIEVAHPEGCTRYVQTAELTLNRVGAPPPSRAVLLPSPATLPPAPSSNAPAAPNSAPNGTPSAPAAQPTVPPASSVVPPASSVAPPVGVFPDDSATSH